MKMTCDYCGGKYLYADEVHDLLDCGRVLRNRVAELEAALKSLLEKGEEIDTQLGYFMDNDSCVDMPEESYPDACGECSYCLANYDMEQWKEARCAARQLLAKAQTSSPWDGDESAAELPY